MTLKKTTMLFEDEVYEKLKQKSKINKVSIGEMVREAVTHYYGIKTKEEKSKAVARLLEMKCEVPKEYKDLEKEIEKGFLDEQ